MSSRVVFPQECHQNGGMENLIMRPSGDGSRGRRLGRAASLPARAWPLLILLGLGIALTGCSSQDSHGADASTPEDYRRSLAVGQVQSYYYTEPQTKVRYPQVRGVLTNLGNRTLIVVEFTLRFKDHLNQVIHEEHAYPVYVSKFSPNSANNYLGPGQKTRFAFKAQDCPPSWQAGQVDIEITKVVFSEAGQE